MTNTSTSDAVPERTAHTVSASGGGAGTARRDDAVAVQTERVETLLAAVRDIVSSLGATSAQLEREVAQALRGGPPPAGHAAPPAAHGGSGAPESDRAQTAFEAERAALMDAVEHRAVIEQAKGMLMLKHRCDADSAFALLVEISRRERRKVRDIASDLVRAGSKPVRRVVDLTDGTTARADARTAHTGEAAATAGRTPTAS